MRMPFVLKSGSIAQSAFLNSRKYPRKWGGGIPVKLPRTKTVRNNPERGHPGVGR